jgi:Mg/Co/Ni transporter MgtE
MTIVSRADDMSPASITLLDTRRRRAPETSGTAAARVADVLNSAVVRIPHWFTAAQARSVASHKGVQHLLVEERGQVAGSVSLAALLAAPQRDPVARWMTRCRAHLSPELSLEQAERRLRQEGVLCLPVVRSGLLMGTLSRDDLGVDVAHAA